MSFIVVDANIVLFAELSQLTGVAALLRFPMPELEEDDEEEDSAEEGEGKK
jgi:hypothetical protein